MLEAVTPKITDISNIKGISTLVALPMLCVAYIVQSGSNISLDGKIWFDLGDGLTEQSQLYRLIIIFIPKSVWISLIGVLIYGVISYVAITVDFPVIEFGAVLMIAFALFGILCSNQFPQMKLIDPFWFYGLIVWGIFLQSMKEQLDAAREKSAAEVRERVKKRNGN